MGRGGEKPLLEVKEAVHQAARECRGKPLTGRGNPCQEGQGAAPEAVVVPRMVSRLEKEKARHPPAQTGDDRQGVRDGKRDEPGRHGRGDHADHGPPHHGGPEPFAVDHVAACGVAAALLPDFEPELRGPRRVHVDFEASRLDGRHWIGEEAAAHDGVLVQGVVRAARAWSDPKARNKHPARVMRVAAALPGCPCAIRRRRSIDWPARKARASERYGVLS